MADLDRQLKEDRALRDAARNLIAADVGLVKGDVKERSVGRRAADLVSTNSREAAHGALGFAAQRPLLVSSIVLALIAFFFRSAVIGAVIAWLDNDESVDEPNGAGEAGAADYRGMEPDEADGFPPMKDNQVVEATR